MSTEWSYERDLNEFLQILLLYVWVWFRDTELKMTTGLHPNLLSPVLLDPEVEDEGEHSWHSSAMVFWSTLLLYLWLICNWRMTCVVWQGHQVALGCHLYIKITWPCCSHDGDLHGLESSLHCGTCRKFPFTHWVWISPSLTPTTSFPLLIVFHLLNIAFKPHLNASESSLLWVVVFKMKKGKKKKTSDAAFCHGLRSGMRNIPINQ